MDILSFLESLEESMILREECEDSELHLRIISDYKYVPFSRDEARLDKVRISLPCRDILEIRIIRAHTSCRGTELTIRGMYASGFFIDRLRESLDIGRLELREGTILEDESCDIMRFGDFFEDFGIHGESCLILSQWLDTELFEEDGLDLFRRIDIEKLPHDIIYLDFEFFYLFTDTFSGFPEFITVTPHSSMLHVSEYREECRLHLYDELFSRRHSCEGRYLSTFHLLEVCIHEGDFPFECPIPGISELSLHRDREISSRVTLRKCENMGNISKFWHIQIMAKKARKANAVRVSFSLISLFFLYTRAIYLFFTC